MTSEVFIASGARTPIGSFMGNLNSFSAPELAAAAIQKTLDGSSIEADQIDEVLIGNVVSAGLKQAPARQAMRLAGIPDQCGATTINKVCGSGMKATMLAFDLIRSGSAETVLSGGMESMSNAPYLLANVRSGLRMGHSDTRDALFTDGLEDAETGDSMGSFAQETADKYQLTREEMDEYAIESVNRSQTAIKNGSLETEIAAMEVKGEKIVDDEQPGRAKLDKIPTLRPAFKAGGTITAANASSISDGASALLLTSKKVDGKEGYLAKVAGHATHSIHPSEFTLAPIGAITSLLDKLDWPIESVDLFEINEAFAMVAMLTIKELGLDPEKVNIFGGACAQGHPIGSTGSRLIVTLAHAMKAKGLKRGVAALCIGGGEATAIALEQA